MTERSTFRRLRASRSSSTSRSDEAVSRSSLYHGWTRRKCRSEDSDALVSLPLASDPRMTVPLRTVWLLLVVALAGVTLVTARSARMYGGWDPIKELRRSTWAAQRAPLPRSAASTTPSLCPTTAALTPDSVSGGEPYSVLAANDVSASQPRISHGEYIPFLNETHAVLVDMFVALNGQTWLQSSGWNTALHYCAWYGVSCDASGAVLRIDLTQNNLTGYLPDSIGNLTQLQFLHLRENGIGGVLPESLTALRSLVSLGIQLNNVGGVLPSNWTAMPSLRSLELFGNNLEGPIPPSMGALSSLELLDLDSNALSGSIPDELCNLRSLRFLVLYSNNLTGTIPSCINQLSNLQQLYLYGNALHGVIPLTLSQLTNLAIVDLSSNNLTGAVTPSLLAWASVFAVSNNQLTGTLPVTSPQTGSQLFYFDVSANRMSGSVPNLQQLLGPQLSYIDLRFNFFQVSCNYSGMEAAQCLPSFLMLSAVSSDQFGSGLTCPRIVAADTDTNVRLDADYLSYQQCGCEPGYLQVNQPPVRCVPCDATCTCLNGKVSRCYPEPFHGVWNRTLPCPVVDLAGTACNPPQRDRRPATNDSAPVPPVAPVDASALFQCAPGYADRLCTRCVEGYYPSGRACEPCAPQLRWLLPLVYVLVLALLTLYLIYVPGSAVGLLKIAIFYAQTAWVLIRSAGVGWPLPAVGIIIQHFSSLAGFSVTAVECVVPGITTVGVVVVYVLVPVFLVLCALLVYAIGLLVQRRRRTPLRMWRARCVYMALFLLYGTYFNISIKVLDLFGCTVADPVDGQLYLNILPFIACTPSWPFSAMIGIGAVALLLYVLGIPALVLSLLVRNRAASEEPAIWTALGFLYASYRPGCYYWELVNTGRRAALALVLALVPFNQPQISVLVVLALLQLCVILQHTFTPFMTKLENRLELASLYVLLISFVGAYVAQQGDLTGTFSPTGLLYALVVINAAFALLLLAVVVMVFVMSGLGRLRFLLSYFDAPFLQTVADVSLNLKASLLQSQDRYALVAGGL